MFNLLKMTTLVLLKSHRIADESSCRVFLRELILLVKSLAMETKTQVDDALLNGIEFIVNNDALFAYVYRLIVEQSQTPEILFESADEEMIVELVESAASDTSNKKFSRKQFAARWYDPMGRSVADAQFGTNGGKALQREKKIPDKGLVTRRVYDVKTGLDAAQIDAAGRTTIVTYDAMRRRVKESHFKPEGKNRKLVRETKTQIDTLRRVNVQTDSLGNSTQNVFDVFGRTIAQIDALGNRTEMVYNQIGELIEQRDPMGRVTRFVYDDLGRRVETILPKPSPTEANPVRKTVYNALGQVINEIDPLGNTTTMEYDAFGRRAAVIDAEGGCTEFTYNATGKMLSLKDPVGNVTSYVYDDTGRLIEETNALGKTRKFEYEGRLPVRKTDRNGRVIEFEYNDFGKPVAEKWLSTDGKLIETIAYHFDTLGKLERVVDSSGVQTLVYDELDRNVQTIMQLAGLETPITLENRFDKANRRTRVTAKIGGRVDFVNQYAYNALGKVTGISQQGSDTLPKQVEYSYNTAGQRVSTSVFAGANKVYDTLYQYDGLGRLTDLTHGNGEKIFADYDFGWDVANRIVGFDFTYLGEKEEKTAEYSYDKTSQLVEAGYNTFQPNEVYEYDANGNRKAFETGKNNQLLSDGVFEYKYDDEGNRVEKKAKNGEVSKYVWDHRNRLVQVVLPKESVTYVYDHQNRMTCRNSEFFVHDGWQIVLVLDAKGRVKDRNLWGTNQDELIATNDQFTLCDHLGSVRDVVDAGGKVLNHIEYNAFGKVTKQTGKSDCVFDYTGKMFDVTTELQWNINRWYDANVGRWISDDPIGFEGKDGNLARYVGNCSILLTDIYGLVTIQVCIRPLNIPVLCLCWAVVHCFIKTPSQNWNFGKGTGTGAEPNPNGVCWQTPACVNVVLPNYSDAQIQTIIKENLWGAEEYNAITKNCCHWVDTMLKLWGLNGVEILFPGYSLTG